MNHNINAALEKQLGYLDELCDLKNCYITANKHACCILVILVEKCEEISKKAMTSELNTLKLVHHIAKYSVNKLNTRNK